MHTHVVTQKCLVTVSNATRTTHCKSKEKQKYEGLSFMLCHRVSYKDQLFTEFWWPHFSSNGNDLTPCLCHASTTYCPWLYELLPPCHLFNFLYISNLIPKLRCTSCFREGSVISGYLLWNSLTGKTLCPTLPVMVLELAPI